MNSNNGDFAVHYTADGFPILEDRRPTRYYAIHGDALYQHVATAPDRRVDTSIFRGGSNAMTLAELEEAAKPKPEQKPEYKGGREARKARREEARRAKKQAMKNK